MPSSNVTSANKGVANKRGPGFGYGPHSRDVQNSAHDVLTACLLASFLQKVPLFNQPSSFYCGFVGKRNSFAIIRYIFDLSLLLV
jgi:hypothetical protein